MNILFSVSSIVINILFNVSSLVISNLLSIYLGFPLLD